MNLGKSISLFLIDGTPDGVIACELSNWTGKAYKIPRNNLKDVSNRSDLKKPGVYFLIGHDEEEKDALPTAYKKAYWFGEYASPKHSLERFFPKPEAKTVPCFGRASATPRRYSPLP